MRYLLILLCLFLFISCQTVIELEYFEGSNIIKTEKIYRSNDKLKYEIRYYYPNGQLKSKGMIVNFLEEGVWDYYYPDGLKATSVPYMRGKVDYLNKSRPTPYIIIEDSLKINTPGKYRAFNYYPGESSGVSCNAGLTPPNYRQDFIDIALSMLQSTDSMHLFSYTGYITPWSGEQVIFYYEKKVEKVQIDRTCMDTLQNQLMYLTKKDISSGDFYIIKSIATDSFPVYQ